MSAPAILAAETRHLLALLELGLLRPRDVDTSLARIRAALVAAVGESEPSPPAYRTRENT